MKFQRIPYTVDAERIEQGRVPALLETVPAYVRTGIITQKHVLNWMITGDYLQILNDEGNYQFLDAGDWLVVMPNGRLRGYTDRDFQLLFEEVPA